MILVKARLNILVFISVEYIFLFITKKGKLIIIEFCPDKITSQVYENKIKR